MSKQHLEDIIASQAARIEEMKAEMHLNESIRFAQGNVIQKLQTEISGRKSEREPIYSLQTTR